MAILISSKVIGQTLEGYNGVLHAVEHSLRSATGFISHCAYPGEGEWILHEIWESRKQADEWFAKFIVPNIPRGVRPKRSYHELHSVVTARSHTAIGS